LGEGNKKTAPLLKKGGEKKVLFSFLQALTDKSNTFLLTEKVFSDYCREESAVLPLFPLKEGRHPIWTESQHSFLIRGGEVTLNG